MSAAVAPRSRAGVAMFAAPAAQRALVGGRRGFVEVAGPGWAYVTLEREWLLLSEASAPFGPLSMGVRGLDWLDVEPRAAVSVSGSRLRVGESVVALARMRERRCLPLPAVAGGTSSAIAAAAAAVCSVLPVAPASLRAGIEALAAGRTREGVDLLAGVGAGLTPAGDDVLAGFGAMGAAVGRGDGPAVSRLGSERASPLGLAYLRCAEHGELPDVAAALLAAICRGAVAGARAAALKVRGWGATSGIALAWGMAAAAGQTGREHVSNPISPEHVSHPITQEHVSQTEEIWL